MVIEADTKGYFQNIDHDLLLELVGRRINDPRVLALIKGWLKSGMMDRDTFHAPVGTGSLQGGVTNIYLHSFDRQDISIVRDTGDVGKACGWSCNPFERRRSQGS